MPERKQNESTRRASRETRAEQSSDVPQTTGEPSAPEAQDVVRRSAEAATAGADMAMAASAAPSAAPSAAVQASPAEITDELEKGGPAFGSFVKSVGLAVAEAQTNLDKTLVETAKALSDTQIDVIAVFEQEINDNGEMTTGKIHKEKLPLINYIMPTAYKWDRVYLHANMKVKEFNGSNGFNIQGSSTSFTAGVSGGYGLMQGGWNVRGDTRFTTGGYQQSTESSFARDEAAGDMTVEAELKEREDIQLPRPFVLQKGPRLKVTAGARTDIMNQATPPEAIGRQVTLTVELKDKANNALANKQIEYRISQPLINYSMTPANGQTDANGQLKIELKREGAAFDKTKPAEPVVVNVWMGLVNEQVSVAL